MDRKEMIALKLQMGINPSAKIAPNVLRAMWQQLVLERTYAAQSAQCAITTNSNDLAILVL